MREWSGKGGATERAARVALVYALVAGLWIGFSDQFVAWLFPAEQAQLPIQTAKGWLFAIVTALVLFAVVRGQLRQDSRRAAERDRQRLAMDELNQFREAVIDNASIWINGLDPEGRVTLWNKAAEHISGYRRHEAVGNPRIWEWLYPDAAEREHALAAVQATIAGGDDVEDFETRIHTRSGDARIMLWSSRRLLSARGRVMGVVFIGRDVTGTRRVESALQARERELATLLANLPGMAYSCCDDPLWTMLYVSPGAQAVTGYPPEALKNNDEIAFAELIHPDDRDAVANAVHAAMAAGEPFAVEYRLRRRDGRLIWVWEQGCNVANGPEVRLEGIIMDIDHRKRMEQELARLAIRDPLTGLYNRRQLERQFAEELARAQRYGHPLALVWLDVDHFKQVNDSLGHLAGDQVLRCLARLVQDSIRTVDYAARYGGEELAVVMPELTAADATLAAERLRALVSGEPLRLDSGDTVAMTVSIGVAAYPDHGEDAGTLMARADAALYAAKKAGRNCVVTADY
ncbi:MAG: diguanylate cyclase [Ectothiorhodospiraceae bacterium]